MFLFVLICQSTGYKLWDYVHSYNLWHQTKTFWLGLTIASDNVTQTDLSKTSSCNCKVQGMPRQGWSERFKQLYRTQSLPFLTLKSPLVVVTWFPISPGLQLQFQFWQKKGLSLHGLSIEVKEFNYTELWLHHTYYGQRGMISALDWVMCLLLDQG